MVDDRASGRTLDGIIIPAVTPFDSEENVDLEAIAVNFARWAATGVAGLMVLGTNGEFRSLSDDESRVVIRQAVQLKGDKTLVAGVGRDSLRYTVEFLNSFDPTGVDYACVLTPNYFGKAIDGAALSDYYTAVADASPIPVIIYVAPSYANGVVVPPATLAALADHPNIAGVKDTSSTSMVDYMLAAGNRDDFTIMAGSLNTLMTALSFGSPGGVVSAANYLPAECAHLTSLWKAGETSEAFAYYRRLQRLAKATGAASGVAGVKACMDILGYAGGLPRRPVKPVSASERDRLRGVFASELPRLAEPSAEG